MQKRPEREEARKMYRAGRSYNEIAAALNASKSTVSLWCRDLAEEKRATVERVRKVTRTARVKKIKLEREKREAERKSVLAPEPYGDYYSYVYTGQDGISRVQLVHRVTRKRLSLAMARYLMSIHLKRELTRDETVRHIDRDPRNDELGNLVLLRKGERLPPRPKACVMCETEFVPLRASVETCSKDCRYTLVSMLLSNG